MIVKSTTPNARHLTSWRAVIGRLAAIAGLAGGLVLALPAGPASAAPSLSVSPGSGLNPSGQVVRVVGSGFNPNAQLFVMQCRAASAEDHTCNSVGLQKVTTNAGGSFEARITVVANFGATDCLRTPCGVKTSAVSGHADDRSQDRSAPVSFSAPAPPVTQPPATQPPATQPPATAPPATAAPATQPPATSADGATTTTTKPGATTTTKPATTTTTAKSGATTTTEQRSAADGDDEGEAEGDDEVASAAGSPVSSTRDDDDGSSSAPLIIAVVVVLAALGAGTTVLVRRRSAGA